VSLRRSVIMILCPRGKEKYLSSNISEKLNGKENRGNFEGKRKGLILTWTLSEDDVEAFVGRERSEESCLLGSLTPDEPTEK